MAFTREKAEQIARELKCDPAAILAVAEVESGGRKDLPDGRPAILFEAHWFSKLTGHRYDQQYPAISSPVWDRSLYIGGAGEYVRLNAASELNREAALKSASWGLFQIMGFNHKAAGFATVEDFVAAIEGDDDGDMGAFMSFVRANPAILQALQQRDWRTFAQHYNGPGAVASYSAKMADAYGRYAGQRDRQEVGPPLPVAAPDMKPKSFVTSKTAIGVGVGGVSTVASLTDQISGINYAVNDLTSIGQSFGSMVRTFGPIVLGVVALCALAYVGFRYWKKMKAGDVVST